MLGRDSRYIEGFVLGRWQANCYILGDVELGSAVVVDPGEDGAPVVRERLAARGVRCEAILLTHGHLDHIWAVPELARELDVPVLLHTDDHYLWEDPAKAFDAATAKALRRQLGVGSTGADSWDPPDGVLDALRDEQTLSFAGIDFQVRHTPGHTPGSSVFLVTDTGADDPLLVCGDLIFAGSVGRTDFPRGSWQDQMDSIARVVLPLDDATVIVPGHGRETTVGAERAGNPFLREIV